MVMLCVLLLWSAAAATVICRTKPGERRWQVFYTFCQRGEEEPIPVYGVGHDVGFNNRPPFADGQAIPWVCVSTTGYETAAEAKSVADAVALRHRRDVADWCAQTPDPQSLRPMLRYIDPIV